MKKVGSKLDEKANRFTELVLQSYQARGYSAEEVVTSGRHANPWICNREDARIVLSIWPDLIRHAGIPTVRAAQKLVAPLQADAAHLVVANKLMPGAIALARSRGVVIVRAGEIREGLPPADRAEWDALLQ